MRSIVIAERTREEKAKIEENRLVVTAANMMLLESNVRFLLLRWLALSLAYCYRNDHPTTEKEGCMPNKRKNEHRTGFRDVFLVALPLSFSFTIVLVGLLLLSTTTTTTDHLNVCIRSKRVLTEWVDTTTIWQREELIRIHHFPFCIFSFIFLIVTFVWWSN